jgi:hypothetical protein
MIVFLCIYTLKFAFVAFVSFCFFVQMHIRVFCFFDSHMTLRGVSLLIVYRD